MQVLDRLTSASTEVVELLEVLRGQHSQLQVSARFGV
jgi:hypothetical protein